jgi:putative ABC transport system permease protein
MGSNPMESIIEDVRFGIRSLSKRPGFAAVAVVTLALGIGANTAIFSVVNAVLLRPLPYPNPSQLLRCDWRLESMEIDSVTSLVFQYWKDHANAFEAAGFAETNSGFNLAGGAEPQRVRGMKASAGFLHVLGVAAAQGREFSVEEDQPNGASAVIISDSLWRNYFGGDRSLVGKQIIVNGRGQTVVGILPHDFKFETPIDVILPLRPIPNVNDDGQNTEMIARLKSGITREQAQADADRMLGPFRQQYPSHLRAGERGMRLLSYQQSVVGDAGKTLWLLFGAVGLVLLIACANVANLLLAYGNSRKAEFAIRVALGASRWRVARQLIIESWLLGLTGSLCGLLIAFWIVPVILSFAPQGLPRLNEVGFDYRVALFTVSASLVTTLLFGVIPAWRATRLDVNEAIKSTSKKSSGSKADSRTRGALIVGEVAVSVVLLIGAALLIKSFLKLRAVDLGFNPVQVTTAQASLTSDRYKSTAQIWEFEQETLRQLSSSPGVVAAATASNVPLERGLRTGLAVEGANGRKVLSTQIRAISANYFRALDVPLKQGRAFSDTDTSASLPVVIINETLARLYGGDGYLLGRQITWQQRQWQIVGVVSDIREIAVDQPAVPTLYVPAPQMPDGLMMFMNRWFLTSWIVRTNAPVDVAATLHRSVNGIDPQLPLSNVRTMTQVARSSLASRQFILLLMTVFGSLALALTAVGIYGVLSYQVTQRTNEIGIRLALGAQMRDVLRLVVGQGLSLVLIGLGIGLASAIALTRVIATWLFGVSARDPLTFLAVATLLSVVAFVACYLPARRATKVDPLVALRYE